MQPRPLLLGHRGARRAAPENTLEAFEVALKHGCDGFEFDLRLSGDGRPVICHDPKLNGREVARTAAHTLGVPTLEDVLAGFASRAYLDIELKVGGMEALVVELLRRYPPRRGFCISSFLPGVVEQMIRLDRQLPLGLICRSRAQLAGWTSLPVSALFLERSLCRTRVVDALHGGGKRVFVWTVNSPNEMHAFTDIGIDGIISDDTALLVKAIRSGGEALAETPHEER